MEDVEPPSCSIRIQPPLLPRIRVEIVELDQEIIRDSITRVVLYFEVADRAGRIEKNRSFGAVFHRE
jgi:hypothetical protein